MVKLTWPNFPAMLLLKLVTSLPSEHPIEVGRTPRAAWGQTIVMVTENSDSAASGPRPEYPRNLQLSDKPPDSLQREGK